MALIASSSKNTIMFSMITLIMVFNFNQSVFAQGFSAAPSGQQGRILHLDALFGKVKQGSKQGEVDLKKIKGSPYLSEEFVKGTVHYENRPIGKLHMRYNAFSDEIEIKKNSTDKEYSALTKNRLVHCNLNQDKLMFTTYKPLAEASKKGYLLCLTNPSYKYVLYKRVKTIFKDRGVEPATSLSTPIEAKFSKFISYYILSKGENQAKELPKKQKKLHMVFQDQDHHIISGFMKDQKISTKKEKDLIKLFNYVNTLNSKS